MTSLTSPPTMPTGTRNVPCEEVLAVAKIQSQGLQYLLKLKIRGKQRLKRKVRVKKRQNQNQKPQVKIRERKIRPTAAAPKTAEKPQKRLQNLAANRQRQQ